ncbi:MAG: LytR C-terminal domain-containing protein [Endomicrobium sp.]|jgi:hypothetical protein|nr:LytR C-terminal domain-containing protein [Endomicrobium sp.]
MRKKIKRVLLISNFAVISAFLTIVFLFIYFSLTHPLTSALIGNKPIKFVLTFYGTEKFLPETIESYFVLYERENKLLKILSINPEAVVFKKNVKARSLKHSFYATSEKDLNLALTNFYQDIFEMANNSFVPDFYVTASFESLIKLAQNNQKAKDLLSNKNFTDRNLQCLNQIEFAQTILNSFKTSLFSSIGCLRKNYDLLDTNISKLAFTNMIMYFRIHNAEIMFFDLPLKYAKARMETDKNNIADMLYTIYYPLTNTEPKIDGLIEIKNASGKPRMAEKAAWKLRENKFDVLEWSNNKTFYNKTLIKNYKGNYGASKKIAKILGNGQIINSYDNKNSFAISVFIGKDCEIYDKFDKKEDINGKN